MTNKAALYCAIVAILLLLVVRFMALETDPPLFYVGHGQSQLTDTYQSTLFARNAVVHGDWNPYDFYRWDVFKNSIMSGAAYLFFSTFGVSRVTANLAALSLQLVGFIFFLLGMYRLRDNWEVVLVALLLLVNSSLFFYGRLPYLENGLIFFTGLLFFVQMRFFDRLWGQLLSGFLIALAGLAGKLFGLLLVGPVLVAIIYQYRSKLLKPLLYSAVGFGAGAAAYLFLFYGGDVGLLRTYYAEQAVGMYGPPPGLQSIGNFIIMLFTYGGESGLWEYTPFFLMLLSLSLIFILLRMPFVGEFKKEQLPLVFCIGWLFLGTLGLSPHYYRPMRYSLFLLLPAVMICGYALRAIRTSDIVLQLKAKSVAFVMTFITFWYTLTQSVMIFKEPSIRFDSGKDAVWFTAAAALIVTLIVSLLLKGERRIRQSRWLMLPFALVAGGMIVLQGVYLQQGLMRPGNYLQKYNEAISQLIDKDAVITGPYAPALTIDNELGALIYMFGLSDIEGELFENAPITHIVSDGSNWRKAREHFPLLRKAVIVCQFVVKNRTIQLYRLPGDRVPETLFEQGMSFYLQREPDSALLYFTRFVDVYPDNWIGHNYVALSLFAGKNFQETVNVLQYMEKEFPDNYMVHGACRGLYRQLHKLTKDPRFEQLALSHELRAIELNPVIPIGD